MLTLSERIASKDPKNILSLDGGGIRGMMSLAILERMEKILEKRYGVKEGTFTLADHFDMITGTSTGAIISAGLALGWRVEKLLTLYKELSKDVFVPRARLPWQKFTKAKYSEAPLRSLLENHFGKNTKLGDINRSSLVVMAKRLDTEHIWAFHNNPAGKFYNKSNRYIGNKNYSLVEVIRASTAAPFYFDPEHITIEDGGTGVFVDGGVTPFNNPSLAALMVATIRGFGYEWPLGEKKLALISVGTGWRKNVHSWKKPDTMKHHKLAVPAFNSLQNDCDWLGQGLLQWISNSRTAMKVQGEVGDLDGEYLSGSPLISYLRYNLEIDSDDLAQMDKPQNIELLYQKGKRGNLVLEKDFPK